VTPPPHGPAAEPLLRAEGVSREYALAGEPVRAVRGLSLQIVDGEYVAIVGPSGCGKSSLLNLLGAIDRPTRGVIALRGRDVAQMSDREATDFRLRHIGFVFQRFHLLPVLTASENVELPMAELGLARRERRRRAQDLLGYVGLDARTHHRPPQLSGGEQQRVAIARALANRPAIVFADEPTGELDRTTGDGILELFARLNRDGLTLITVTHDAGVAARAGRTVHMADGAIVSDERNAPVEAGGPPQLAARGDEAGDRSPFRRPPG
jgi:putative ABC transport system ATP-binding protein